MAGRSVTSISEQKASVPAKSAESPNLFNAEFKAFVNDILSQWNNPGVSLAVIDGENVYAEGFGDATLPDTKATSETLYFTGSTTKAFTAALLAHLINSKEYPELARGWNTPISSILRDDFVLQDEWATKHLTLRDAAGHITGMSRHDLSLLRETDCNESTNKDFVRNMRHLPYVTEPRTKFQYCNYMYFTLSHVIETLTGMSLEACMRKHIFKPLGMSATFLNIKDAEKAPEHLASSYFWPEEGKEFKKIGHMPSKMLSGAGGLISTVVDYTKWLNALIHKADVFNDATHKDIRTSISIASATDEPDITCYGLGWTRLSMHGQVVYTHNGSTGTFGSYVMWLPHLKFGVVAFSNGFESAIPVTNILARRLLEDRLCIPENERVDRSKIFKENERKEKDDFNKATEILYANRPEKPVPSTLPTKQLEGKYHHAGYGTIHLIERPHPQRSGENILVAERPDCVFPVRWRFEHASGDFWTASAYWLPTDSSNAFQAVEFRYGVNGKPSAFEMSIVSRAEEVNEGKVLFERVE